MASTRMSLKTWKRLWPGQGPLETMAKFWSGVAVILQLSSSCLLRNISMRSPEVLGFSPGEYLDSPHTVHEAAAKVTVPIFVTSAKDRDEIAAAKSILAVAPARQKTQFVSPRCWFAWLLDAA